MAELRPTRCLATALLTMTAIITVNAVLIVCAAPNLVFTSQENELAGAPQLPSGEGLPLPHFTNEQTEAQRTEPSYSIMPLTKRRARIQPQAAQPQNAGF